MLNEIRLKEGSKHSKKELAEVLHLELEKHVAVDIKAKNHDPVEKFKLVSRVVKCRYSADCQK